MMFVSADLAKVNDKEYSDEDLIMMTSEQFANTLVETTKAGLNRQEELQKINDRKLKIWLLPRLLDAAKEGKTSIAIDLYPPDFPFSKAMTQYLEQAGIDFCYSRKFAEPITVKFSWVNKMNAEKSSNDN